MGMYEELDINPGEKILQNVRTVFLKLTQTVNPYGTEHKLRKYLPDGLQMDGHGNYYMKIGESESMFTCHLDQHCRKEEEVRHSVSKTGIVSTLGNTVLGGDDKAGAVVLMCMIEAGVPGLYYFFIGEESAMPGGGTFGSRSALSTYEEKFKKYKRCISFDRRGKTSIISEQSWSVCCSQDFVKALVAEFKKNGMDYEDDPTGSWTDSAVFMNVIPECTNISVGYQNEHKNTETQDIKHLRELCNAAVNIDWENLPTARDTQVKYESRRGGRSYGGGRGYSMWDWDGYGYYGDEPEEEEEYYTSKKEYDTPDEMFEHVLTLLMPIGYWCENEFDFKAGEKMKFEHYVEDDKFELVIDKDMKVFIDGNEIGDYDDLVKYAKTANNVTDIKKSADEDVTIEEAPDEDETIVSSTTSTVPPKAPSTTAPKAPSNIDKDSIIARHYKFGKANESKSNGRRLKGFKDFY